MTGAVIDIHDFFLRHPAAVGASASCLSGRLGPSVHPSDQILIWNKR